MTSCRFGARFGGQDVVNQLGPKIMYGFNWQIFAACHDS